MKIVLVTDSWSPDVSGVVRTYQTTIASIEAQGHEVQVIEPSMFWSVPLPSEKHLRLAITTGRTVGRMIAAHAPDAIHIATEGTLALAARNWCVRNRIPFTTSYTTKLPEYMQARIGIPARYGYPVMRWFHRHSSSVMVATDTLKRELEAQGFRNLVRWSRGVDAELFRPRTKDFLAGPRPIWLYVGRIAKEKNISAFLDLKLDGTKYVVGDGAELPKFRRLYPHVQFVGNKFGIELARHYSAADVFVFPSRTDTFGLVMLEALASGVPVAAYPVPGPQDVIGTAPIGALDDDLQAAARRALSIPSADCRAFAQQFDWEHVARQFLGHLRPIKWQPPRPNFLRRRRDAVREQQQSERNR